MFNGYCKGGNTLDNSFNWTNTSWVKKYLQSIFANTWVNRIVGDKTFYS